MASKSASNHTEDYKSVKQSAGEGQRLVNPSQLSGSIEQLSRLSIVKSIYQRNNGITSPQWDVLMVVVNHWERMKSGISVYAVCKLLSPERDFMGMKTNTLRKCVWLLHHGYLEIIGYGKGKHWLLAPTGKVLQDLMMIVQSA